VPASPRVRHRARGCSAEWSKRRGAACARGVERASATWGSPAHRPPATRGGTARPLRAWVNATPLKPPHRSPAAPPHARPPRTLEEDAVFHVQRRHGRGPLRLRDGTSRLHACRVSTRHLARALRHAHCATLREVLLVHGCPREEMGLAGSPTQLGLALSRSSPANSPLQSVQCLPAVRRRTPGDAGPAAQSRRRAGWQARGVSADWQKPAGAARGAVRAPGVGGERSPPPQASHMHCGGSGGPQPGPLACTRP